MNRMLTNVEFMLGLTLDVRMVQLVSTHREDLRKFMEVEGLLRCIVDKQ